MKNIEKSISVEKNEEDKKSIAEQLEGLQSKLNSREEQSQLAKEGFGINLEKANYLARVDEIAMMITEQKKSNNFQTLAFDTLGIA